MWATFLVSLILTRGNLCSRSTLTSQRRHLTNSEPYCKNACFSYLTERVQKLIYLGEVHPAHITKMQLHGLSNSLCPNHKQVWVEEITCGFWSTEIIFAMLNLNSMCQKKRETTKTQKTLDTSKKIFNVIWRKHTRVRFFLLKWHFPPKFS